VSVHKSHVTVLVAALMMSALGAGTSQGAARSLKNCTAMHRVYAHGVGRPGAHDHTSGTPVTNFKRSTSLYRANSRLDRDKDGIACEKR
jgi:hypothetical protein